MKKTRKIISVILAVMMVLSIVPITASAEENTVYDYTVISEEEKTCRLNGDDGLTRTEDYTLTLPSEVDGYKVVEISDNFTYYSTTSKIIVPDSVERIGKAFDGDGVLYLVLGAGVSDFNAKNFSNMDNLKEFIVSEDNPYICSVDGVVFTKDMKTLLRFPTNHTDTMYEIPDGVEVIGERAFDQGWNLTQIKIPNSVTTIESRAFSTCQELYRLYVGKGIQTIGEYAFSNCPKLADVYCSFPETKLDEISISTKGNANLLNAHFQFDDTDHECEYYVSEVVPPNCSYDGYTLYVCSICGSEMEDDYVPATEEHNIVVVGKTDPTCTEKGYTTYACTLCGGSYEDDYVAKLGHNYEETETPPGTSECVKTYLCSACGYSYTSNGHTKVVTPAKVPTMTEAGTTRDERCSNCGLVYLEGQIIPALNENSFANLQGDNLIGVLDKEARTLTIYGTGTIEDEHNFTSTYDKELGMTVGYTSYVDDVNIKEGVTGIGDDAFTYVPYDTIIIPDSVTKIGDSAFYNSDFSSIIVGDGVETIGAHAFRNCYFLKEIELGKKVKAIGVYAFLHCDSLEFITVDSENQYFSSDEFGVMFNKDKTTLILCPQATKMTSYTIPDTVTTIKEDAFVECGEGLKSITIPKSVTVIEDDAITTSGSMFHPTSLDIYYLGIEEEWNLINDGNGVETDGYTTVHFGENVHEAHHSETIVTPPTCTAQGYTTFTCDCGFTYAEDYVNPTGHTDNDSDKYCDSCYEYIGIDTGVFGNKFVWTFDDVTGTLTIYGSGAMSHYGTNAPFKAYKDDIKVVVINEGITEISDYAFYSYGSITDVIIHDGVTKIGFSSFENCYALTTVTIPDSVTHIDNYAFYSCYKLRDVKYSGTIEQWREITIDSYNQPLSNNARRHYNSTESHTIEYELEVTAATCFAQGYTTYTCGCGDSYVDNYVDATGHNYNAVVTAPTCTEQGCTTYTCECGETYVGDYVDALGHKYSEEITTPATHTATGIETFTCDCGDTYTESIEKIAEHNHNAIVTAPTCTEQGYTTYTCECGDTYIADFVDELGHTEEIIPAVAPTCTETGLTEGAKCSVCGETLTEQKELPANGHTPANAVEENYVAPTCTENGSKDIVVYCSVCDEEIDRETETIEATGHADNDGDGHCDADNELLDPSVECECNCHKSGISKFFFNLILFFQKLFGSNQVCDCGAFHY